MRLAILSGLRLTPESRLSTLKWMRDYPGPPGFVGMVPKGVPSRSMPPLEYEIPPTVIFVEDD